LPTDATLHQRSVPLAKRRRGRAFVRVVAGRDQGTTHRLAQGVSIIGRTEVADIQIVDDGVSRRHAKIFHDADGTAKIVDLSSTNGTYVNGRRVEVEVLREGDRIRIGSSAALDLVYEYDEDEGDTQDLDEGVGNARSDEDAIETYERSLSARKAMYGESHPAVASLLDSIASALRGRGDLEGAIARHQQALAIYDVLARDDRDAHELPRLLVNSGESLLRAGRISEALVTFERALESLERRRASEGELAAARFGLARSLDSAGREPLRAKTLAQLARDGYRGAKDSMSRLAEVEHWLKHTGR